MLPLLLLLLFSRHRGGTASGFWTTASPLAVWERARARSPELAALHTVWLFSRAKGLARVAGARRGVGKIDDISRSVNPGGMHDRSASQT